jgi:hypothetical protein
MDHIRTLLMSWGPEEDEDERSAECDEALMGEEDVQGMDCESSSDPQEALEYTAEIHQYLRDREAKYHVDPLLFKRQADINSRMRLISVSWMHQLSIYLKLEYDTFFVAVQILDRYLSTAIVSRDKLQLVAVGAMFIACKYEETTYPRAKELAALTDDSYTRGDVLKIERKILRSLRFEICGPLPSQFRRRVATMCNAETIHSWLAKYLLCLSQLSFEIVSQCRPSLIAASAMLIARRILQPRDPKPDNLIQSSGYTESELQRCILQMNELLGNASEKFYNAIRDAFSRDVCMNVAEMKEIETYMRKHARSK